jgi:CheY-like chemotaxis protein
MDDKKSTRIALVSEQPVYLRGMESLVISMEKVELVGEARSCAEASQLCQLCQPDLVLLDIRCSLQQGCEVARQIHQQFSFLKVVLLYEPREEDQVLNDFDPPMYYFSRDVSEDEFKEALTQISRDTFCCPEDQGPNPPVFRHQNMEDLPDQGPETIDLGQSSARHWDKEILARELVMAGKIQADILPEEVPTITGWDIATRLEPARETSGDFYDFIPLTDHKWGVVIADVTDKGMGAAIFMALSSTLIRTYATRFPTLPAISLNAVSERILNDTRGGMFVTMFFGVLETHTDRIVFANAGHPPGFLVSTRRGKDSYEQLRPTGMALGVSNQAQWKQKVLKPGPGDVLVLYTDGITEAQNSSGDFFGEDRILDVAFAKIGCPAAEIRDALLAEVHRFVGSAPPQDDIALIVIKREE